MASPPVTTRLMKIDAAASKVVPMRPSKLTGLQLYSRYAFAGAICCSVTHGILTPVDVIKTRIQLDPVTYNSGLIGTFRQVIAKEGAQALLSGLGPTVVGYFLQGALRFGGYEFFKKQSISWLGHETASNNRTTVYLTSAALAEFFGDIALCPLEATRIRLVAEPTFANGLASGFTKIAKQEGIGALYSGFGPILLKQIPYTMAAFVVYENAQEIAYKAINKSTISNTTQTAVNLGSGLLAGFAAALVSQPADTMLSKINKTSRLPGEGTISRLLKIAKELGLRGSYSGIGPRLVMVGGMGAGQFAIYGSIKKACVLSPVVLKFDWLIGKVLGATGGVEIL
ncbi:mitochondrial carrier domain-containing protein [Leptodontidium sp. MPI-SDFR-AT-0119]|nr:mitochondrial carrier domain-containing protein [Leptodontidium sp. MPI-SDFR-AT-0119]